MEEGEQEKVTWADRDRHNDKNEWKGSQRDWGTSEQEIEGLK